MPNRKRNLAQARKRSKSNSAKKSTRPANTAKRRVKASPPKRAQRAKRPSPSQARSEAQRIKRLEAQLAKAKEETKRARTAAKAELKKERAKTRKAERARRDEVLAEYKKLREWRGERGYGRKRRLKKNRRSVAAYKGWMTRHLNAELRAVELFEAGRLDQDAYREAQKFGISAREFYTLGVSPPSLGVAA